ncbi:MAG: HD domain-containing protein, partial [Dehalococcoidia bacterium]
MSGLSTERVAAELDRLLDGMAPGRGLRALASCGGLEAVLPELAPMRGCEQNSFHRFDVWEHTVVTVDMIAVDEGSRRLRRWAALLHDVGKPGVRHRKANGEWGFFRHETAGAEVARRLMLRLGVAKEDRLAVELVVRRHMDRPRPEDRRSVRRFMHRCRGHWEDLLALQRADNSSHTYDDSAYADALSRACREAAAKDAEALKARSPLSGDDLMALFGRKPGPWIRRVKDRLGAMVLDGDLAPDDREAAARAAAELVAEPAHADGDGRRQAP